MSCTLEANEYRHEQSVNYDYVGEILYGTANYTINMTSMVNEWFLQGINYDYSQKACVDEDGEASDDLDECVDYLQVSNEKRRMKMVGGGGGGREGQTS